MKSRDDTKYFDEEDPVSDVDDASSYCSADDGPDPVVRPRVPLKTPRRTQVDGAEGPADLVSFAEGVTLKAPALTNGGAPVGVTAGGGGRSKKVKEKKRPRDRLLRDKEVGRKVLELRKRGAFLGYTYQRPCVAADEEERGRSSTSGKS